MEDDLKRKRREKRYQKVYGITIEEYDRMFFYQKGACAICGRPPKTLRLSVDHDHKSGMVRGLLCMSCNMELRERITADWLSSAISYMQHPPAQMALGRLPQGKIGRVTKQRRA